MTNSDMSLVCFKAISNFTSELGELFSNRQRSLKLYCRLINKTTIVHHKSINKHIDAFRSFCVTNREAIVTKSMKNLTMNKISYSQRVFIDMIDIFNLSDKDTSKVIWEHLLCISALVDPAGKAREVLRNNLASGKTGGQETNFLTDIIDKVEANVDPNANPMEAISSIMKSGIFTDLIGGMNSGLSDGSLDIGKLMGAVQGMVGKLGEKTGSDPKSDGAMNMLTTMMSSLGDEKSGEGGAPPDLAGMMKTMMGGGEGGAPPDLAGMMKTMMGGGEGGAPPDLAGMMKTMMGGGEGGAPPDLAGMMKTMMGGGEGGAPPDLAGMMKTMMGGGEGGAPPDLAGMSSIQEDCIEEKCGMD
jgi:hypothetical protein